MRWPPRYCPDCGAPSDAPSGAAIDPRTDHQRCAACGADHYRNAKPTAGALISRGGRLLLGRRAFEPRAGAWDVVGGFLHAEEHPEQGARREALEETGLNIELGPLLGVYLDRYGAADDGADVTFNLYYLAEAGPGEPLARDDVAELRWFEPGALADVDLAFPHQRQLIEDWARHCSKADSLAQEPAE